METEMERGMRHWTIGDVSVWLRSGGFDKYVDFFRENAIDGEVLLQLTTDDLFRMVKIFGDLFKLNDILKLGHILTAVRKRLNRLEAEQMSSGRVLQSTSDRATSPIPVVPTVNECDLSTETERSSAEQGMMQAAAAATIETTDGQECAETVKEPTPAAPPMPDEKTDDEKDESVVAEHSQDAAAETSIVVQKEKEEKAEAAELSIPKKLSIAASYKPDLNRKPPSEQNVVFTIPAGTFEPVYGSRKVGVASTSARLPIYSNPMMNRPQLTSNLARANYMFNYSASSVRIPDSNEYVRAYICYAESPLEFSVIFESEHEKAKKISKFLNNFYERDPCCVLPLAMDRMIPGTACAVKFTQDGEWYRALILKVEGDDVLVRYVDFGNSEKVPRKALMTLTRDRLCEMPPLCVDCRLANIPPDFDLTDDHKDAFFEMADPLQRLYLVKFDRREAKPPHPVFLTDTVSNNMLNNQVRRMLGFVDETPPAVNVTPLVEHVPEAAEGVDQETLEEMDKAFWGEGDEYGENA